MNITNIFIDCGAPSLYNQLSKKSKQNGVMGSTMADRRYDDFSYVESNEYTTYRQNYIEFVKKHEQQISIYSNLDVINNPRLTAVNQRILEDAGLHPLPVWHLGSDEKYLKRYLQKYDYIAIGGLVPNPTSVLIPMLDRLFKEYFLENGVPVVKLHGFACTSLILMNRYPWYSVDSATCRKMAIYGNIIIPTANGRDTVLLNISERTDIRHKISPLIIRQLQTYCEIYKFTVEELQNSYMCRTLWNYLMFYAILDKTVPKWPWHIDTRESSENATHFLDFYLAGTQSKEDEYAFWQRCESVYRNRLISFFYGKQSEFILYENKQN